YKPDGQAYAEVARIKVAETPVYAHPVVAGKRIFVRDADSAALYTIGEAAAAAPASAPAP
ncbi:MAG: hypothetical protein NTW86_26405, partial [Candidatus Sumerlaeota bacterium]|nr:hypothetical protein [Candidatus Sumerlaeota bacterium]